MRSVLSNSGVSITVRLSTRREKGRDLLLELHQGINVCVTNTKRGIARQTFKDTSMNRRSITHSAHYVLHIYNMVWRTLSKYSGPSSH